MSNMRNLLFFIASLFVIVIIWVVQVVKDMMPYTDVWTRDLAISFADSFIYTVARAVTNLGSESFLVPFTIIVGLLLWWGFRDWFPALLFSGGTLLSHLLNMLIKAVVARERPSIFIEANAEGFSFPSGHSMITMVCYGMLMFLFTKRLNSAKAILIVQVSFALLIFMIGMSRFVINVHYLTDIVAGFIIGFTLLLGLIYIHELFQKHRLQK